ncbi:MAG: polysaccharide biosynthesis C-terminal domain-containing protein [Phycisphaerales bacterium]|nr:polysaccharide biosynthesis C-terminal domain-containing protein [Phycisphaerales bacterium]
MSNARSHFLSHAGIYLLARGLPGILAFAAIPVFSRLLSPEDYGRYALVIAAVELLNALLFQWTRLSLLRYNAVYRDQPDALRSTLLSVTILTNTVLVLVAGGLWLIPALAPWHSPIAAGGIVLIVQSFYDLVCEQARATLKPWHFMLMQSIRSGGFVGLGLVAVWLLGWSWFGPLGGMATGMLLAVGLSMGRHWRGTRLKINRPILARLAQYGLPLSLTVALAVVIGTCDRYLLAWYLDEASAGSYAVAYDFTTQTLTLLMLAINMAAMPLAIRAYELEGPAAAQEQMRFNATLLLAIGVPAVLALAILVQPLVHNLLGAQFRTAATRIIPLVALGAFLANFKAFHFDSAFQFAHRTIYQVWIVLAAAVVNVILNVLFIPRWGLEGSAIASVLAYIVSIALTIYYGRRQFVLPFPWKACSTVCLAALIMGAVLWPLRHHTQPLMLGLQIIVGVATYAAVLLLTNFLNSRRFIGNYLGCRRRDAKRHATNEPMTCTTAALPVSE